MDYVSQKKTINQSLSLPLINSTAIEIPQASSSSSLIMQKPFAR
jgi:hypothetical protein